MPANPIIGDINSPSWKVRLEYLINRVRLAVESSGQDYGPILAQIYSAVDELELKVGNIDLSNTQISVNTDQVESQIAGIQSTVIEIRNFIDTVESRLNDLVTTTSATTNNLQALHLDLVSLIALCNQILNTLIAMDQRLSAIELLLQRRIKCLWRKQFDAVPISQFSISVGGGTPFDFDTAGIGPIIEKTTITNITGDGTNTTDTGPFTQFWIFGNYYISGAPNGAPDRTNYDFVVSPGETLELLSTEGFILVADGAPGAFGQFVVTLFGY